MELIFLFHNNPSFYSELGTTIYIYIIADNQNYLFAFPYTEHTLPTSWLNLLHAYFTYLNLNVHRKNTFEYNYQIVISKLTKSLTNIQAYHPFTTEASKHKHQQS